MYKKILLPTDGSTYADQEVERVENLISEDGEIIVLSVAGRLTSSAFQSRKKVRKVNDKLKRDAHKFVDNMAAKFDDDLNVTKMVLTGFAAETINEVAEKVATLQYNRQLEHWDRQFQDQGGQRP